MKKLSDKEIIALLEKELTNFSDACKIEGLDSEKVRAELAAITINRDAVVAAQELFILTSAANRVVNEGKPWIPDWNNYDEYKYANWFEMGGSSGFRFRGFGGWFSHSCVGSRLCFIHPAVGRYVATHFLSAYKQFMVIN